MALTKQQKAALIDRYAHTLATGKAIVLVEQQ